MKILTVVGARPQFVKAAVISRLIRTQFKDSISEVMVHTGQHFDKNMSDIFFSELEIGRPKYNLGVKSVTHGAMTGAMIVKLEELIMEERPNYVLVYGDTNSTLAGAIAAIKLKVPIAHVEAGLRSFNMAMPEEINRILTDRVSTFLFCPTVTACNNLRSEGVKEEKIKFVGDVMFDSVNYYRSKLSPSKEVSALLSDEFALVTIHRAENTDDRQRLARIMNAVAKLADNYQVVLPLHPRTKTKILEYGISMGRIKVIDPVGYNDMLCLLEKCSLVLTDSGGLQKEAYFMGKHCLILRGETEWVELLEVGANVLVDDRPNDINSEFKKNFGRSVKVDARIYGDGAAGISILNAILEHHRLTQ